MITRVDSSTDRSVLRELLVEFHAWMDKHAIDIYDADAELTEDFQSLDKESESWAWIAWRDGEPAGCVLLYGQTESLAEFRRLWVREEYRGEGFGRDLTETVIEAAQSQGYETLGLTTPPWAAAAQELYESLGFVRTPPYQGTRLAEEHHEDAIFMQLDIS